MSNERITAHEIALTFMAEQYQRNFVIQHYTPHRWAECDICEFTASNYFREYEIKVSRSDFFIDAKKVIEKYNKDTHEWIKEYKHELLANGDTRGPANFTFIVPKGLITIDEVPEWAGLIEVEWRALGHRIPYRLGMRRVKDGRRLHNEKANPDIVKHARGVCYYRMHNVLLLHARQSAKDSSEKIPSEPVYDFQKPISAPTGLTTDPSHEHPGTNR